MAQPFPFQAVIFDMDGVIVDTELYYWNQIRDFSEAFGLGLTVDDLNKQVGQSHQAFQRSVARWLKQGGRGDYTPEEAERVYDDWARDLPKDYRALMNPGVGSTIEALKGMGVRVALASSSPRRSIDAALTECGLEDAFELIVSGADFKESKPNPEIYLHTIAALGLPAEKCCCIEDSVPGITAGKCAGLTVIAKREERFGFSQDAADIIIDQIPDVLSIA